MPKQNEVEIKLRLDPEKIRNFANSEGLAGVQPLKKHYRTTYFDDNKHHLFKSGFELRVRHDGRELDPNPEDGDLRRSRRPLFSLARAPMAIGWPRVSTTRRRAA